ncbi:MAG TPA: hypothetical protein VHO46_06130 [Bacteroidales bacterium]|nr:hypothetical protein [Bacteroidales bacterium]
MKSKTYNLKVRESSDKKSDILLVEGDLSLKNAVALKKQLQTLKFRRNEVVIQLQNVEKIDITTIQIIRSYRNYLNDKNISTSVIPALAPETEKLIKNTGFETTL